MKFLLRTLSWSYVRRHRTKTLLTLIGVIVGVATFTAIRAARLTLVDGIKHTVDRMAGKAHLQIEGEGGVPEQMQEALWELDGIRAQAPVIQQVVMPERTDLGSLLVLGIDLLGDSEMREYGFDGEDADLDDPLLFLAQADSIALSKVFADRAGLGKGDRFAFHTPLGVTKEVVVRGLLESKGFAEGYAGNVAVLDVYAAQEVFGRGRRFDRLEVRLEDGSDLDAGKALVASAIGPGYRIETPARRSAHIQSMISNFSAGFTISSGFALGIGIFLIFNAFSVAVNRRRRDIGTLRALGATPRQVQALFLLEAVWVGAVGGIIGLALGAAMAGASLTMMNDTVAMIYGYDDPSTPELSVAACAQSVLLGVLASLVGAWGPARAAARVHPTEALARGSYRVRLVPTSWLYLAVGWGSLALAVFIAVARPIDGPALMPIVLILGVLSVVMLTAPAARACVRWMAPLVARLAPVTGLLAVDSLTSNPRRTSSTIVAMTLSLAFVLGQAGYIDSANAAITRWMDDLLTSDLYVRASADLVRPDYRYPAELRAELLALPGVKSVESFRGMRVPFRDDEVLLLTVEMDGLMDRATFRFEAGDEAAMRRGLVGGRECAVSDNFSTRFGLGVGDVVELDTPAGLTRIPIAAVVVEFSSDRGSLYLDRAYAVELFGDDRVDTYDVSVAAGVDPLQVRGAIQTAFGGRYPALILTREEFTAEIAGAVDAFYSLMRITLLLALGIAFLGIVSSLLISVAERTREIGILKALGALRSQIQWSVVFEAQVVALVGLLLAIPIGFLQTRFMETTVAQIFTGWTMPHRFSPGTLVQLAIALPIVSAVAGWIPARLAAKTPVTEAIEYE